MTINAEKLLAWEFPVVDLAFSQKDAMLYALGVGLGTDPTDERELPFVYEERLAVLPSMAVVLGHPGPWFRDPATGIDWIQVLHGEQTLAVHGPLVPDVPLRCTTRVVDVEDKGEGRGALVRWARDIRDVSTGKLVATLESTLFCRNDGGFGGEQRPRPAVEEWPSTQPTDSCLRVISPRAALLYRLNGDMNPVHADPKVAADAGFERPILHGLCTFAVAIWSILSTLADDGVKVDDLSSVAVRFKAPVLPGQALLTDMWREGDRVRFRSTTGDGRVVLDMGDLRLQGG
ncbi:MaoC/PaaZ C-terminal domain-containing protein [Nocardioides astragali]|uniref:MaoC/PaaZ C-terminal domain-containing protein n=1 Tax=Nocardioides astragali TaxID=1776736 RepID=A0ABW2N937_9ACTN|nr:MaoC/PaaZ C-terminal domain-containing protein [Nocardioides astragali]